jgi:hypothetical protein
MFLAWLIIFIPIFYLSTTEIFGATGRAEDTARYTLPMVVSFAAIAGIFVESMFDSLREYNKILGAVFIILISVALVLSVQPKLDTMKSVKGFSEGFFNGCNWIQKNTPADSIIFSIYAHHTMYFCNRESISALPDDAEIQLTNNDTSYEHLKLHGFNYVYIQAFTISTENYREAISTSFLDYLNTSDKFEKVLDNTNVYGNGGVILYKIL